MTEATLYSIYTETQMSDFPILALTKFRVLRFSTLKSNNILKHENISISLNLTNAVTLYEKMYGVTSALCGVGRYPNHVTNSFHFFFPSSFSK